MTDFPAEGIPATAQHAPYSVDCPNEPHIDDDGACWCCAPCCCDAEDNCICPFCAGSVVGCNDHG